MNGLNKFGCYSTNSFKTSDPLSHSCSYLGAWWEVDLGEGVAVSRVVIYNRNDGSNPSILTLRLSNSVVSLINYQGNTLKTYRIGDATNVPVFNINFDSYLGCYAENQNPKRILPYKAADNLHPNGATECAALCKAAGYTLAGTQYSEQCWCGNSLNGAQPISNNECNMQCLGNAAEMCGGPYRNSVYTVASILTFTLVHNVRVQLEGYGFMNLREVEVYDMSNVNRALSKPATQSSTYLWSNVTPKPAVLAVNGIIDNTFDMSHTTSENSKHHKSN